MVEALDLERIFMGGEGMTTNEQDAAEPDAATELIVSLQTRLDLAKGMNKWLKDTKRMVVAENNALTAENQQLRETLEKYADRINWRCGYEYCDHKDEKCEQDVWVGGLDGPHIARTALAGKG